MQLTLTLEMAILLLGLVGLLVAFLFALHVYNARTIHRLTAPIYERVRNEATAEAKEILQEAREHARTILAGASTDREKLATVYREQIEDAQQIVKEAQMNAQQILLQAEADRDNLVRLYQDQLEQANGIIGNAQDQAKQIIASAREQREEIVSEYADQINKLQASYQVQLESHTKTLVTQIDQLQQSQADRMTNASTELFESIIAEHTKIRERFNKLLTMLEKTQQEMQQESKTAVDSVKERLQQTAQVLSDQLESYDTTITKTISEHINHTYEKIDEEMHVYREARQSILDRHIQQIIEDVANRVLRKQLTITEHAELARTALREAQKENVF